MKQEHPIEIMYPNAVVIFFRDLKENKQEELLKLYEISSPVEKNWDVFPLTIIERIENES